MTLDDRGASRAVEGTWVPGPPRSEPLSPAPPALTLGQHALALGLAILGGLLGAVGAVIQELPLFLFSVLPALLAAPVIEEMLKPAGVYVLLARWPRVVRSQLYAAFLTGLSGLTFGFIESAIFVAQAAPAAGPDFALYRFTVTPALHLVTSFIFGLGLNRDVVDWAAGRAALPRRSRNLFIGAVVLHGVYNFVAIALAVAGILDFD
jgi:hypothetical protein